MKKVSNYKKAISNFNEYCFFFLKVTYEYRINEQNGAHNKEKLNSTNSDYLI